MDAQHAGVCASQRQLFSLIAEADQCKAWRDSGARDMAHWLWMRYGISDWKARRWIAAAHALEGLPQISEAFASGELGIDKVVELTRFATAETEGRLITWAQGVSCGAIRHKGGPGQSVPPGGPRGRAGPDPVLVVLRRVIEVRAVRRAPRGQGAVVAKALERLAEQLPVMPGGGDGWCVAARRADALVALCSARIGADPDPDRATVIIHARLEGLVEGTGGV